MRIHSEQTRARETHADRYGGADFTWLLNNPRERLQHRLTPRNGVIEQLHEVIQQIEHEWATSASLWLET